MRFFDFFIPMILFVSLLTPMAHALTINIDVSGIVNAVNGNTQSNATAMNDTKTVLNNTLGGLPLDIFSIFKNSAKNSLFAFNTSLLSLAKELISANPDPQLMFGWWQSIVTIISCFYLLVFLVIGFAFMINGHSVVKREQAKEWLKNAVMMIIGVSVSFYLYQLILELSSGITKFLWVTGFEQFFEPSIFAGAGILLLLLFSCTIALSLITLFLRYVFLLMGVVLFPIGIFLYLTPKFDNWGKIIFNFLGVMLATQFIDVIVLIATQQALLQLGGNAGASFVLPLGFLIITITNIAIILYAIVKSALSIVTQAPILNMAVSAVTGNIAGVIGSAAKTGATA